MEQCYGRALGQSHCMYPVVTGESLPQLIMCCAAPKYRLPETTRIADKLASAKRGRYRAQTKIAFRAFVFLVT